MMMNRGGLPLTLSNVKSKMRATAKRRKQMKDSLKWHSKRGLWVDKGDEAAPPNTQASCRCEDAGQVVDAYMQYLGKAADASDKDGEFDYTDWNAKKLVWEMGNTRSLAAIRNVMYKYQELMGVKYATLGSGPRITVSKQERIAAAKAKAAANNWNRFEV